MFEELISFDYVSPSILESSNTNSFKLFLNLKCANQYIFRFMGDLTPLFPYESNLDIEDNFKSVLNRQDIAFESGYDCFIANVETSESVLHFLKNIMDSMPLIFTNTQFDDITYLIEEVYTLWSSNRLDQKSILHLDIIDFYIVDEKNHEILLIEPDM